MDSTTNRLNEYTVDTVSADNFVTPFASDTKWTTVMDSTIAQRNECMVCVESPRYVPREMDARWATSVSFCNTVRAGPGCSLMFCGKSIYASDCAIIGNNNKIVGNNNTVTGNKNEVVGDGNTVVGRVNHIYGHLNVVSGIGNKIHGNDNVAWPHEHSPDVYGQSGAQNYCRKWEGHPLHPVKEIN